MIAQGDYSEFVDRQVQHLLDDNPDAQAIVFANDEMAFSGYHVCEQRGLKVSRISSLLVLMTASVLRYGASSYNRSAGWRPDGKKWLSMI